jgi:hypothetical protein
MKSSTVQPKPETEQERDKNGEGRKGQKMAAGTKVVRNLSSKIRLLGWLGNLDSNQD